LATPLAFTPPPTEGFPSDVNKPTSHKAKAKATAVILNKTSDVIYLLQSITVNSDKNKITVITPASIF